MSAKSNPGVGALTQLQLIGPQEKLMYSDDPGATNPFSSSTWPRATRGAIEQNEITFPFELGKTNKKQIPRRGDMLGNLALSITLPIVPGAGIDDFWAGRIGYVLLRKLRLTLNDAELDSSERLLLTLQDELFVSDMKRAGVLDMIGGTTPNLRLSQQHTIVVPLKFFNCFRDQQKQTFLPLISAGNTLDLVLEVDTEKFENCITSYAGSNPPTSLECELITDYAFLDSFERERLVNRPFPVLVESTQDVEGVSWKENNDVVSGVTIIPTDTVTIDMKEINFPVKYLTFVAYSKDAVGNLAYFQFEDVIDRVSIVFDGTEREVENDAKHYSLVNRFYHARRAVSDKILFYSFAIDAYDAQPSGHFSFSNVIQPILKVKLKQPRDDIIVKTFVSGLRWIDFEAGYAALRYT